MSRYIDADGLCKEIKAELMDCDEDGGESELIGVGLETALDLLQAAPIVEAEPIRHGHWIVEKEYGDGSNDYYCSCCTYDDTIYENLLSFYKYCPYCGAKMDEVTK